MKFQGRDYPHIPPTFPMRDCVEGVKTDPTAVLEFVEALHEAIWDRGRLKARIRGFEKALQIGSDGEPVDRTAALDGALAEDVITSGFVETCREALADFIRDNHGNKNGKLCSSGEYYPYLLDPEQVYAVELLVLVAAQVQHIFQRQQQEIEALQAAIQENQGIIDQAIQHLDPELI